MNVSIGRTAPSRLIAAGAAALLLAAAVAAAPAAPQAHAAVAKPGKAVVTSAKAASSTKVTVTVKKQAKVTAYQYRISAKSTMAKATVKNSTKTSTSFAQLKQYTTYYVQARAYKTVKGKKYYGAWSTKKKVRTLCAHPSSKRATATTQAATCTEPGATKTTCSQCKKTLSTGTLEPLGHDYADVVTPATCGEDGKTTHACTRCDDSSSEPIPALAHPSVQEVRVPMGTLWQCPECLKLLDCDNVWSHNYPLIQQKIDATGVKPKGQLDDYTWAELKAVSKAIAACEYESEWLTIAYAFGLVNGDGTLTEDVKYVPLNDGRGFSAPFRILGFNHDDLADGSGKAGISFESVTLVQWLPANATNSNLGGWRTSSIRMWLHGTFYKQIPAELREQIVEVAKTSNNVGYKFGQVAPTQTKDKVWLLSSIELLDNVYNFLSEGKQYQRYAEHDLECDIQMSTINPYFTKASLGPDQPGISFNGYFWFLRSAYSGEEGYFRCIINPPTESEAKFGITNADRDGGVAPCFCI
ncbi:MAG: DUF6273 domain-containing protein [Coriobacteriia bacterium]|nr:DUF6273 domain-containing protein [Coriobacteriia bacterium]